MTESGSVAVVKKGLGTAPPALAAPSGVTTPSVQAANSRAVDTNRMGRDVRMGGPPETAGEGECRRRAPERRASVKESVSELSQDVYRRAREGVIHPVPPHPSPYCVRLRSEKAHK